MVKHLQKIILAAIMLLAILGNVIAKEVSPDVARKVATNFMRHKSSSTLVFEEITNSIGFTNFYVFNAKNEECFVIVAADDKVQPILAYSLDAPFKTDNIPQNIIAWLWWYEREIQMAKENNENVSEEIVNEWKLMLEGRKLSVKSDKSVNALLTTKWDQGEYYNNLCPRPLFGFGPGGHTYAGCVATAMGQVMKYWDHPSYGSGSHSYNCSFYGTQSVNFATTAYDWSHMPNQLTSSSSTTQVNAVATLLYHCGVSVDMDYGYQGSGAYPNLVAPALINYFNYDANARYVDKSNYSNSDWISLLKTELDARRPIFYSGNDGNSGHAFVCDGYDNSNYFHFNWGWSGYCDGFYSINNLAPGSGGSGSGNGNYTTYQGAVIGIQPSTAPTANIKMYENLTFDYSDFWYGSNITGSVKVINNGNSPFSGYLAVAIFNSQNMLVGADYFHVSGLQYNYYTTGSINITGGGPLIPEQYTAYAMYSTDGNIWNLIPASSNAAPVSNFSIVYSSNMETYSIFSTTSFVQGQPATINVDVLNAGSSTFNGYVSIWLDDPTNDSTVQIIQDIPVSGLQSNYHYTNGINFTTNAITVNPGTYLMVLGYKPAGDSYWYYAGSSDYSNPVFVTVVAPPTLTVAPSSINFQSPGGSNVIEVTSNVNWTVSSSASWLTFNHNSGSESGYVVVAAATNHGASRSATITVSGDNGVSSRTVRVNQSGIDGIDEIESEASNITLQVLSNRLIVEGIKGEHVFVTDVLGRVIYHATVNERAEIAVKNRGVYFVKVGNRPAQKVVVVR